MQFLAGIAQLLVGALALVVSVLLGVAYGKITEGPSAVFALLFLILAVIFALSWITRRVAEPPHYVMRWNGPAFWVSIAGLLLPVLMILSGYVLFWTGHQQLGETLFKFRYLSLIAIGVSQIAEATVKIPKAIS